MAADDAAAKGRVMTLIREIGFESVDVGPLKHARHLEGMAGTAQDSVSSSRGPARAIPEQKDETCA